MLLLFCFHTLLVPFVITRELLPVWARTHDSWPISLYAIVLIFELLWRIPHYSIHIILKFKFFFPQQIGHFGIVSIRLFDPNLKFNSAFLDEEHTFLLLTLEDNGLAFFIILLLDELIKVATVSFWPGFEHNCRLQKLNTRVIILLHQILHLSRELWGHRLHNDAFGKCFCRKSTSFSRGIYDWLLTDHILAMHCFFDASNLKPNLVIEGLI